LIKQLASLDKFVVLTEEDKRIWDKLSNKIVIPNPLTRYPDVHSSQNKKTVISVGSYDPVKGFDMLIDAFALIANKCLDWKIDIYGDGPDKQQLIEKIKNNNMDNRIVINPPTNIIYEEYQKSEFFVLSSRFEGFPLVLGEAMSCGIPCVAFNCKYGPEDIIRNNKNGLLVENGNIKELSEKILWMIEHVNERLRMGQIAREDIQKYKKEIVMQKWIDLFDARKN
jgi:glycosyltransferase involved in cell wall biosynthesis